MRDGRFAARPQREGPRREFVGILGTWAATMRAKRGRDARWWPLAGLGFSEFDLFNTAAVPFDLFREGDGRRIQNMMWKDAARPPAGVRVRLLHAPQGQERPASTRRWQWFGCALAQHNGKWPELRVTKERLLDRAAQTLGLPDIELESEEFNRTYVVQCESPKFATDLLDPQMMEFILGTEGLVDFQTKGRFLLVTTSQVDDGRRHGRAARVSPRASWPGCPPLVWDLYGRFPDGMGTEDMPPPPTQTRAEDGGLFGATTYRRRSRPSSSRRSPPRPHRRRVGPDARRRLRPRRPRRCREVTEDPWGEGRSRAP